MQIGEWDGPTSNSVPFSNGPVYCWMGRIAEWVRTPTQPSKLEGARQTDILYHCNWKFKIHYRYPHSVRGLRPRHPDLNITLSTFEMKLSIITILPIKSIYTCE